MKVYKFQNYYHMFPRLLEKIMVEGALTDSRNGSTRALYNIACVIEKPEESLFIIPGRGNNIACSLYEVLWMLSGDNRIEYLKHFMPRAADYSDDGETWRGAYGTRLRFAGAEKLDQIHYIVESLRKDPMSRQAVATLWDPEVDTLPTKDRPCNNMLQFYVSGHALNLNVYQRSQDFFWGSQINYLEWSVLLWVIAKTMGLPVGTYTHIVNNLHVYEPHWDKANRLIQNSDLFKTNGNIYHPKYDLATARVLRLFSKTDYTLISRFEAARGEIDRVISLIRAGLSGDDLLYRSFSSLGEYWQYTVPIYIYLLYAAGRYKELMDFLRIKPIEAEVIATLDTGLVVLEQIARDFVECDRFYHLFGVTRKHRALFNIHKPKPSPFFVDGTDRCLSCQSYNICSADLYKK